MKGKKIILYRSRTVLEIILFLLPFYIIAYLTTFGSFIILFYIFGAIISNGLITSFLIYTIFLSIPVGLILLIFAILLVDEGE